MLKFFSAMPRIFIQKVHIVGMYHYGNRQLDINSRNRLVRDAENRYDRDAVKVVSYLDESKTVAFISRHHAPIFSDFLDSGLVLNNSILMKPKFPVKTIKRVPTQLCTVAFYVSHDKLPKVTARLESAGFGYHIEHC